MKIAFGTLKKIIAEIVSATFVANIDDVDEKIIQKKLNSYLDSWTDARSKTVYGDRRYVASPELLKKTKASLLDRINAFTMYVDEQLGKEVLKDVQSTDQTDRSNRTMASRRLESTSITIEELRSLIREVIINPRS